MTDGLYYADRSRLKSKHPAAPVRAHFTPKEIKFARDYLGQTRKRWTIIRAREVYELLMLAVMAGQRRAREQRDADLQRSSVSSGAEVMNETIKPPVGYLEISKEGEG
jgi:hypothetical protein